MAVLKLISCYSLFEKRIQNDSETDCFFQALLDTEVSLVPIMQLNFQPDTQKSDGICRQKDRLMILENSKRI